MKTIKKQNYLKNSTENVLYGSKMFVVDANLSQRTNIKYYPGSDTVSSLLLDEFGKHTKYQITNETAGFLIDLKDFFMK